MKQTLYLRSDRTKKLKKFKIYLDKDLGINQ